MGALTSARVLRSKIHRSQKTARSVVKISPLLEEKAFAVASMDSLDGSSAIKRMQSFFAKYLAVEACSQTISRTSSRSFSPPPDAISCPSTILEPSSCASEKKLHSSFIKSPLIPHRPTTQTSGNLHYILLGIPTADSQSVQFQKLTGVIFIGRLTGVSFPVLPTVKIP